jgi:hypothetical protein
LDGPNRNDSLYEKLEKLKPNNFIVSSLYTTLPNLPIDRVAQQLCLLVSLYIPLSYKGIISNCIKGIKGYYINFETFTKHHTSSKPIVTFKRLGIDPFE